MKRLSTLVAVAVLALAMAGLAACGSSATPSEATGKALEAIKAQDNENLKNYYAGEVSDVDTESLASELMGSGIELSDETKASVEQLQAKVADFDYEIGEEKVNGDSATVDVTVTTYDLGEAFTEAIDEYLARAIEAAFAGAGEDEIATMFLDGFMEKMSAQTEKSHVATTTFNLSKVDGEWKLDQVTPENLDALTGGIVSAASQLAGQSLDSAAVQ